MSSFELEINWTHDRAPIELPLWDDVRSAGGLFDKACGWSIETVLNLTLAPKDTYLAFAKNGRWATECPNRSTDGWESGQLRASPSRLAPWGNGARRTDR